MRTSNPDTMAACPPPAIMNGQKLTIFSISSMMANTTVARWNVKRVETPPKLEKVGYEEYKWFLGGGTNKPRARKQFNINFDPRLELMFDGHDLPIYPDGENPGRREGGMIVSGWSGNACYNLAWRGIPAYDQIMVEWEEEFEKAKAWIEKNCLNWEHVTEDTKSRMMFVAWGQIRDEPGNGVPFYPELIYDKWQ